MTANNDITQYNQLKRLSVLDYYSFIEMVSANLIKMQSDGQNTN
jgi:hypothetical protein